MSKIVIFGATSAIAMETAKLFAEQGCEFVLVARDAGKLSVVQNDLRVRGAAAVHTLCRDLADSAGHAALWEEISRIMPAYDTVLVAYGSLPDQQACQADYSSAEQAFKVNFLSVVSLLTFVANVFEAKRCGTIAVISSVAGDRGRQSNYIYGTAKGALSIFLQGLRNRLHAAGVTVVTIKPGFVNTPMTAGLAKGALFVGPEVIARGIFKAIDKSKDVVYLPWFWFLIMALIKAVPEFIFKRQRKL